MSGSGRSGRITRDQMFMRIARIVAQRSTCTRAQVGAVIVQDNRIISMGYVGAPPGLPHCSEVGCDIGDEGGCQRTIHAEANAINYAARKGMPVEKASLYTTLSPCLRCSKDIISSGITLVVFETPYRDFRGVHLLEDAGIPVFQFVEEESKCFMLKPRPLGNSGQKQTLRF